MSDRSRRTWNATRPARVLTARRSGRCAETGKAFPAGESVLWIPPTDPTNRGACYLLETATATAWLDDNAPADSSDMAYEDSCRDACGL